VKRFDSGRIPLDEILDHQSLLASEEGLSVERGLSVGVIQGDESQGALVRQAIERALASADLVEAEADERASANA
jgi:hypothetical protein